MGKKSFQKPKGDYKTYALAEKDSFEKDSNVSHPSLRNVKEAKDWVDANEK